MKILLSVAAMMAFFYSTQSLASYTLDFDCITYNSTTDCSIGENQLSIEINDIGNNQVEFIFLNTGLEDSSIEGVYFDDGSLLGISYLIDKDDGVGGLAGVDFTGGSASPPKLPGDNIANPKFIVTSGFLADSDPPTSKNGVNPNEWLGVVFDLQAGREFEDVLTELGNGDLRIGMHVIAFESGGSESFVNNAFTVPLPAPVMLFASGILLILRMSKHRKAR